MNLFAKNKKLLFYVFNSKRENTDQADIEKSVEVKKDINKVSGLR